MANVDFLLKEALVLSAATFLINQNGKTTTLEVKNLIRQNYPNMSLIQSEVSNIMANYIGTHLLFDARDMGNFHEFKLNAQGQSALTSFSVSIYKTTRTEIANLLLNSKVPATEVTWIKKAGAERTLKDVTALHVDVLGYIQVDSPEGPRKIDPRKLISAKIGSKTYIVAG